MDVTLNTSHTIEGVALMTMEYRDLPNVQGVLLCLLRRVQEAEQMLYDVWFYRQLANALGDQLDQWGLFLGSPRADRDDDEYRIVLMIRFRTMRSKTRPSDLIEIAQLAAFQGGAIAYSEPVRPGGTGPNAFFSLSVEGLASWAVVPLKDALHDGKASGVGGELVYSLSDSSLLFRFGDTVGGTEGRGFGSTHTSYVSVLTSAEAI